MAHKRRLDRTEITVDAILEDLRRLIAKDALRSDPSGCIRQHANVIYRFPGTVSLAD